jgi:hypothetical protein
MGCWQAVRAKVAAVVHLCAQVIALFFVVTHNFLNEKRGYWKLKKEALGGTLWRSRFGKGYVDL